MNHPTRLALALSAAFCATMPQAALASGFALTEQNASGLGNAYAGQAASAQDASTVFFNPAGLTKVVGRQFVVVGNFITPSAKFSNTGTLDAMLQSPLGGEGGDAGSMAFVPNFYYAMDVKPGMKFGLGIDAPFGLKTDYDSDWMGRFLAVKSKLDTININPSLAWQAGDALSLGVGLDFMYVSAELSNVANYSALIFQNSNGTQAFSNLSGLGTVKGHDWGYGANIGLLYQVRPDTRVGLSYRSEVSTNLKGDATLSNAPSGIPGSQSVTAKLHLPASASLSLFHALSPRWDVLADASWTGWSSFKDLTVLMSNGTPLPGGSTPENWRDTMRYSLGVNFHQSELLTWRLGTAYDQSPVPDQYRTPRIPDQDRTWLTFGLQYKPTAKSSIDAGYAHLFVKDASIHLGDPAALGVYPNGQLNGTYKNHVDILSVQYTHDF